MIWYIIFGFFAATGALFLLWLIIGAFLPKGCKSSLAVCCPPGAEMTLVRRYRWLRELGMVRGDLTILDSTLPPPVQADIIQHYPGVTFSTAEQWLTERK